jgi:hypothetical protein
MATVVKLQSRSNKFYSYQQELVEIWNQKIESKISGVLE